MKTLSVLLLQCLATLATASAPQAFIYTHDVQPRPSSPLPDSVSSDTAYSIWARRLGLSEQRRLTGVDDTILNQIDQFGGHRAPLFGKPHSQIEPSRLSIAIEGYNDGEFTLIVCPYTLADMHALGAARLEQSPELTVGKPLQELADALTSFKLWNGRDDTIKIVSRTQENIKIRIELAFKVRLCPYLQQRNRRETKTTRNHVMAHVRQHLLTRISLTTDGKGIFIGS